eukprot:TRINITY_DN5362_c0_g1_i1.p1 TRINITY_DN5362_c0_g1~~TRINITY_DN5362_c0_g1_i1.p1  ORF type:complete len:296 (+),score=53.31 TRINITY_DN5362_c0_g1_i1:58-945(+)
MDDSSVIICGGHTRPVVDLAFSDVADGSYWCVSACKDGKPMLRNGETGDWVGTFDGHKGATWGAAITGDATRAATASADFTARIWDALTGSCLATLSHSHIVRAVSFTKDASRLATSGQEKLIRVFDTQKTDAPLTSIAGHTETISHVGWIDSVSLLASTSADGTVRLWDTRTNAAVHTFTAGAAVTTLEVSHDKQTLTVAAGNAVYILSAADLAVRIKKDIAGVSSAALSPDGKLLAAGCADNRLRVVSLTGGEEVVLRGHHGGVHTVAFTPTGSALASGSEDGTIRIWKQIDQ